MTIEPMLPLIQAEVGFHPVFSIVDVDLDPTRVVKLVVPEAVDMHVLNSELDSGEQKRFSLSNFIALACRDEVMLAADALYDWFNNREVFENFYLAGDSEKEHEVYSGYPIVLRTSSAKHTDHGQKLSQLKTVLDETTSFTGSEEFRTKIFEPLTLCLTRILAKDELNDALQLVLNGTDRLPHSIFLQSAKYAVELLKEDIDVPDELKKYIGAEPVVLLLHTEVGFHPVFSIVDVDLDPTRVVKLVVPEAVDMHVLNSELDSGEQKQFSLSNFIALACRDEVMLAADALYDWFNNREVFENFYLAGDSEKEHEVYSGYPIVLRTSSAKHTDHGQKLSQLKTVLDETTSFTGNEEFRTKIFEPLTLCLTRILAKDELNDALQIVLNGTDRLPRSIFLKSARHAVELLKEDIDVPEKLQKFVGEDTGYLHQFICPLPFERFDVSPDGSVLVCCGHWLPTPIGNILDNDLNDVLNSEAAKKLRQSVTDGSYRYCNHLECGSINQESLPPPGTK